MNQFSTLTSSVTSKALIAANLIPLVGVLFFAWDLRFILVLYWVENIVIGIFNLIKMLFVNDTLANRLFNSVFFCIHYGGFCAAHGLFLFGFLDISLPQTTNSFGDSMPVAHNNNSDGNPITTVLSHIKPTFDHLYSLFGNNFTLSLTALFISHGFSLIENFFIKGERHLVSIKKLFSLPYPRIIVLHITIILGGIVAQKLGSPLAILALLICIKVLVDLKLHQREHRLIQTKPSV